MPIVAVAGLGAVVAALIAVMFILSITVIIQLVARFGGNIPVIGSWLASQAANILALAVAIDLPLYKKMLWALQTVVDSVVTVITYVPDRIFGTVDAVINALENIVNTQIPRAIAAAETYAGNLFAAAQAKALYYYDSAITYASNVLTQAKAYADGLASAVHAYAAGLFAAAESKALYYYDSAITYASNVLAAAQAYALTQFNALTSAINSLNAYMTALVGTAVTSLEADLATLDTALTALIAKYAAAAEADAIRATDLTSAAALTLIWPGLVTDVDNLIKAIPKELTDIGSDLAAIPRAIPADLAGALAALGALAIPMLRYLEDCGVPLCHSLHALSDLYNDLFSVATDAAMLGLFVEAVANPYAAADAIFAVVGPVTDAAATITRDLIGV